MEKWILVTGGSRGIGREIVRKLSNHSPVIFTWYGNEDAAKATEMLCQQNNFPVAGFRCDGSDAIAVEILAAELSEKYGPAAGIVHNAGIVADALHFHLQAEQWHSVINTNLTAIWHWNKALLPQMIAQKAGSIVLMSSVTAIKGNIGQTAYAATKAAMMGLARSLALEVGRFNIRVNCLLPGIIESDLLADIPPEKLKAWKKQIPLRRFACAEEVAMATEFLLSSASSYMTGQSLILDGGLSA